MQEKISIVVPIYNVEKELDRCLQSLLRQTYKNIEIILVDDGSPDRCPLLCDEYAQKDSRVRVIHKKNGGLSDARNVGLQATTGEYVLYIDSDDYIDLDSCERFLKATEQQKVDIVVGSAIMEKSDGSCEEMLHTATPSGIIYNASEFIEKSIRAYQWYAPACFNMYRRDFLLQNELFFKVGIYFEDMQMLPRVFLSAQKIACIDGVFYHYVVRDNSIMTSKKDIKKQSDSIQNLREWKEQFDHVQDAELRKILYGMLVKCYLHECRVYGITKWEIDGVDFKFVVNNSLNFKEKIKGLLFALLPKCYVRV